MRTSTSEAMRKALEDILNVQYKNPPPELVHKVIELATILQGQYTPTEWDSLCARTLGCRVGGSGK